MRAVSLGSRALDRAFCACGVLALLTIWLFHYPAGIDLPQHANILRILADYSDPRTGYAAFYERQFLTPYFVTYVCALPFAKLFGALVAVKVVLSIAAIATPWTMIRWLQALRAEPWWGLFGFPLTFGFGYHWGFLSFVFVMPFMFGYLIAYRRLVNGPTPRAAAIAAGWALLTYFCHGIAFAVAMLASGLEALLTLPRARSFKNVVVLFSHWLPAGVLSLAWQLQSGTPGLARWEGWPPENDRFVALLAGELSSWPSYWPALAGGTMLVVMMLASRPALAWQVGRVLPLVLSLAIFFLLPETVIGTWLVGMRMLVFVHIFATAAFRPGVSGRSLTVMRAVTLLVVVAGLVGHGVRMRIFNQEMRGLAEISEVIPPYADVHGLVRDTNAMSEVFGGMLPQTPAWVTAANGGFLENDYGHYFQLPIQRPYGKPWVGEYRWFVARGPAGTLARVTSMVGPVRVVKQADDWWLLESTTPPITLGGLEVVRYAQDSGRLSVGHSRAGGPLQVAGQVHAEGLATHALSRIQVRVRAPGRFLKGMVGIDDSAGGTTALLFEVMDTNRKVLFQSPPVVPHQPPLPFAVPLDGRTDLVLSVELAPGLKSNDNAHADWLDLRVSD
ncbi:MAG TPA: NPCBM/NEW2 domain-containing protein [Polyangia bacterium]